MITPEYIATMARYNQFQNNMIYDAADVMNEDGRRLDRGAFFGSIHGTLCHILWADTIWMSRFDGWDAPEGGIPDSPGMVADWAELRAARRAADARIGDWSGRVRSRDLEGDLTWYSGALGKEMTRPRAMLITHMFNHQTHHRGQVHAMLTAAGARLGATDLPFLPEVA